MTRSAGITNGDLVVVRQQEDVASGDIVAALIEGIEPEATVKTFQQSTDGQYWLMPHNPAYAPIPGGGAKIMGKVVAVPGRVTLGGHAYRRVVRREEARPLRGGTTRYLPP